MAVGYCLSILIWWTFSIDVSLVQSRSDAALVTEGQNGLSSVVVIQWKSDS